MFKHYLLVEYLTQKTYLDDLSNFTFWFQLVQFQVCCPHLLVTSEKGPVSKKSSLVEGQGFSDR